MSDPKAKLLQLATEVESLYTEMSTESNLYQARNKIYCPSKCSNCCKSPTVSATPLEMLPLAFHLINSNQVPTDWSKDSCIFHHNGCSKYLYRPTVCRLFGWAQVSGKTANRLSVCPTTIKNNELSPDAPNIELWASKVRSLEPSLGTEILPINQALKLMVEKILLYQRFDE